MALSEHAPKAPLADKTYDAAAIRTDLARRTRQAVIPGHSNRRIKIDHDRVLYSERNYIGSCFGRLKTKGSIATRYDQPTDNFLIVVQIATVRHWLKFGRTA
ncbi:hypothetical protein [Sphingomonas sp. 28-63-12]|uniref:hypothetical protein n=1 Tax=Sphingomonas sp. 28-63-12 TaxID=1970434 RepID=UPI0035A81E15